jgi:hypothetical protein
VEDQAELAVGRRELREEKREVVDGKEAVAEQRRLLQWRSLANAG